MLLKRLELQGFKSFADKTVLDFMDGTTAVVGPNGSGKSNISDAIRWVIGETSARTLRGSNMQDIIFAGTQTRRGVSYAEVSLVLDNSTHEFDVDYDEITVTRRIFRSGESEYLINKAKCRLKDVRELFMDTGLGKDGYSMIGQGSVSQILSTKAEERRGIFEEAAGVSKYKYKKEEALKKLSQVEENLVRIRDISHELESQLGPLERQSEKAKEYLSLYGDMKELDIALSVSALNKNKSDSASVQEQYDNTESEYNEIKQRESGIEEEMNKLYEDSNSCDSNVSALNERLVANESATAGIKNEITILENNIANRRENISRLENEIEGFRAKSDERRGMIELTDLSIKKLEQKAAYITSNMSSSRSATEEFDVSIKLIDEKTAKLREEYFTRENEITAVTEKVNGIEKLRESYKERRAAVYDEITSFKEGVESIKAQIEETRTGISDREEKLRELNDTVTSLREQRYENDNKLVQANDYIAKQQVEYNSMLSKKKILEGMENDYSGYARSVKAVLTAAELKGLAIYGTISGLVDVNKKYVTAVETALGGAMQNIIVESEEDAKQAIAYLRRTNAGRATFLPVTSVRGKVLDNASQVSKEPGFIGIASELIRYDKKYTGIFNSLLGRVVVVDNIDNAIALSRKYGYRFKTVTLAGDVLNAGGSMSGGSVNKQSGFLSRAAEIKTLTSDISKTLRSIEKAKEKREGYINEVSRLDNQINTFMPLVREYEDGLVRLENTLKHLEENLGKGRDSGYEQELNQLDETLKATADEVAEYIASVTSLKRKNKELEERAEKLLADRAEIEEKRAEFAKDTEEFTEAIAELNKEIALSRQSIKNAENEIVNALNEIKLREESILRYNNDIADFEAEIEAKKKAYINSEDATAAIREEIKQNEQRKQIISEKLKKFREDNKGLTDRIIELQKELSRFEGRLSKLEADRESTLGRLWDDYEITYSDASSREFNLGDEKQAAERLVEIKKRIKALGSVNIDSIEEYKSVKERYGFMTQQREDLEKSKNDLVQIIDSMEELMKEHFSEQFTEINTAFNKVFKELFGGGHGRLYLSSPDDVLNSGIEIEVQLPGKSTQNINLYSGGEKSFIAIALMFAILKVKPTPFCILDEIDAALDDVNVSRFATYLKNYTDRTQFVVITHRRGTMEAAAILYGVTMQESGVSKLLSLKIDDIAADETVE